MLPLGIPELAWATLRTYLEAATVPRGTESRLDRADCGSLVVSYRKPPPRGDPEPRAQNRLAGLGWLGWAGLAGWLAYKMPYAE